MINRYTVSAYLLSHVVVAAGEKLFPPSENNDSYKNEELFSAIRLKIRKVYENWCWKNRALFRVEFVAQLPIAAASIVHTQMNTRDLSFFLPDSPRVLEHLFPKLMDIYVPFYLGYISKALLQGGIKRIYSRLPASIQKTTLKYAKFFYPPKVAYEDGPLHNSETQPKYDYFTFPKHHQFHQKSLCQGIIWQYMSDYQSEIKH